MYGINYDEVIEIAKKAGEILVKYHGKKVDVKNKDPNGYSPVSTADLEANKYICNALEKYGFQILSEESEKKDVDLKKPTWIIDPLDGTIGFLRRSIDFCTMIGLLVDTKIVFGVVYAPLHDKIYYAAKGEGAWLISNGNRRKIHVSKTDKLSHSLRAVRPFNKPNFLDFIMDGKIKCRSKIMGSLGLRLCSVAEGEIDFYINNSSKPSKWDTAAPTIIIEEAGGKITDFNNKPLNYIKEGLQWDESFVASNGILHDKILMEIPKNALDLMNMR
ncbi:MAG: 3'(2'),5'-bisphosphate nucleotidase CysQ [Candidatus Woesearchaeota archaeon]|nr:MAG: 3'(2'),5'-bisphosphate nucleotidase CysQ [Candidatus Woesearchaeota archaeon]